MKKLTFLLALLLVAKFSFAQWEPDVRLTNSAGASKAAFANTWGIASQGDTLHVVWYDSRDGNYEIYYKKSCDGGDTWGEDTRLTSSAGDSETPGIAVSGSVLHVSWEDTRNGPREIYYKRSMDGGLTWESDVRMTYANMNAFLVSVAVMGSYVHLTWQDERDGTNSEVYYKRSTDGGATWDNDVRLTNDPGYSGLPSVAVSGSAVHIAWEETRDGNADIYYIRSADNGTSWGDETRLTNTILESWDPAVAVAGSVVHCAYMEDVMGGDYEIFYMRSTNSGLTWEEPVRLSNNTASSIYPNISAYGQDVHVLWKDQRDGQPEIYYRESGDGGATWPGLETRLTNSAGISENSTACVSPNAVNIVWNDNRSGDFEIYYKRYLKALPESVYYERLFYLCKAWGFAKYHHTAIAAGNINWDDELFKAIQGAKDTITNEGFNDSLQRILENAGEMGYNPDPLPEVPDSLDYNDYSWIQDDIFTDTVRSLLDTILSRFRPQSNVYVNCNGSSVNVEMDQLYYLESAYPTEEKRLLALFRYWNIIQYFFPHKNLMDQDWDSTLVEFIPQVVEATDSVSYMLSFKELTTRINDSHGYLYGMTFSNWRGNAYPPFLVKYVENEMVVTKVLEGNPGISVGDVIKAIDGVDIYDQRDSLRKYAHGSNDPVVERELDYLIMYGPFGNSQVVLDDGISVDTVAFSRNSTNFNELMWVDNSPMWTDTVINGMCHFGIVNMYNLESSWVADMFYDLWETDAIIFDIRRGAYSTIQSIVNYIYSEEIELAKYKVPACTYPGTYYWNNDFIGGGIPEPYSGNIIILFNEGTQSHGEWTCMGFEPFPGLIKIGSQTAGADGSVAKVYVPGKISAWFTGFGVNYPDYTQTQRVGIVPDYEVHPTIAGIRAGIDEVLAFALDCSLLSTPELDYREGFTVYPNPASRQITVGQLDGWTVGQSVVSGQRPEVRLSILDLFGREIKNIGQINSFPYQVDISNLPDGVYVLKITDGSGNPRVAKFIKVGD